MIDLERKCLFIASEVRSGSTYIAESIAYETSENFGFSLWGLTKEHFSFLGVDATPKDVLDVWGGLYLDESGFAASKLMCKALSVICRHAIDSSDISAAFFGGNTYWVVVRRRDRIKQAVSLAMAAKTGVYHFYGNPEECADRDVVLTDFEVEKALRAVILSDCYLEVFSSRLTSSRTLTFYYEDFMDDELGCLNQIHGMCGFKTIGSEGYSNLTKLRPTAQESKGVACESFKKWFLENYI